MGGELIGEFLVVQVELSKYERNIEERSGKMWGRNCVGE